MKEKFDFLESEEFRDKLEIFKDCYHKFLGLGVMTSVEFGVRQDQFIQFLHENISAIIAESQRNKKIAELQLELQEVINEPVHERREAEEMAWNASKEVKHNHTTNISQPKYKSISDWWKCNRGKDFEKEIR